MPAPSLWTRRRPKRPSARWLPIVVPVLLCWSFAANDARAQAPAEESEDSKALPVARAKPRPRLFGRLLGQKPEPDPEPLPKLPPEATKPPGAAPPQTKAGDRPPEDKAVVPSQFSNYIGYSYENVDNVPVGSESNESFLRRLIKAYRDEPKAPEPPNPDAPPERRGLPAPFTAPPMPFSDFIGPTIGVNDTSVFPLMDALYRGPNGEAWKQSKFKIYGWADPSYNASTSRNSNAPLAYNIAPNSLQMSQQVVIIERTMDTVQQDHFDWGFRFTNLYGIDYRFTTAKGYFSDQLLKHNHLYLDQVFLAQRRDPDSLGLAQ
jgi:hypothetical protein